MPNPFVHVELYSNDLDASKKFFAALLGWKLSEVKAGPEGKYTMIEVGEGTGGGMMKNPVPGSEGRWVPYVEAADMDAMLKQAQSLGAKVVVEKTEVMGMGWIGIVSDPTGVMFGFWQTKK
jgi:hypothetical protein